MKNLFPLVAVCSIILGGCIPTPYEKAPSVQSSSLKGSVSLVDLTMPGENGGLSYQAQITAQFNTTALKPSQVDRNYRGIQCQLIASRRAGSPNSTKKISVGSLFLGTPTSTSQITIPEISEGVYEKALLPHFAPGIYFIRANGKDSVKSFGVEFSMPEEVRGVRVNQHGLEEGPAVIQKTSDLLLEVDPVTAPNDMNIIELFISSKEGDKERILVCGALENQLEIINGKTQFVVPSAQLSGLFPTTEAVIEVLRVNALGGTLAGGLSLSLEGTRAWLWPSLIAE